MDLLDWDCLHCARKLSTLIAPFEGSKLPEVIKDDEREKIKQWEEDQDEHSFWD